MSGLDDAINKIFGKGGSFDKLFSELDTLFGKAKPKVEAIPRKTTTGVYTSFSDLRNCEFKLSANQKHVLVRIPGTVVMTDHSSNKSINYRDQWFTIRDSLIKPPKGFAFDLVDPVNPKVTTYFGQARSGDENHLATYANLKKQVIK